MANIIVKTSNKLKNQQNFLFFIFSPPLSGKAVLKSVSSFIQNQITVVIYTFFEIFGSEDSEEVIEATVEYVGERKSLTGTALCGLFHVRLFLQINQVCD